MTFKAIVEQARDRAGSANALARRLQIAPPSVLYWLWGSTLPAPDKLVALASIAQLDPVDVQHAWLLAQMERHARGTLPVPDPVQRKTPRRTRKPIPIRGGSSNAAPIPTDSNVAVVTPYPTDRPDSGVPLIGRWRHAA